MFSSYLLVLNTTQTKPWFEMTSLMLLGAIWEHREHVWGNIKNQGWSEVRFSICHILLQWWEGEVTNKTWGFICVSPDNHGIQKRTLSHDHHYGNLLQRISATINDWDGCKGSPQKNLRWNRWMTPGLKEYKRCGLGGVLLWQNPSQDAELQGCTASLWFHSHAFRKICN